MKTIRLLSLILTFVLVGCAIVPDAQQKRDAQFDDIREAVFRYQFEHATSNHKENAVCFLAVADSEFEPRGASWPLPLGDRRHDPSDRLMAELKDQNPPVRKNSELRSRAMRLPPHGLRFRVTEIKWFSETEVEVKGGHDDAWSASWITFNVKKENGKWMVVRATFKGSWVA